MSRVVPADGRSRAYVDGRMATLAALADQGESLVDLHGQHAHQSLLSGRAQRGALDAYAGVDAWPPGRRPSEDPGAGAGHGPGRRGRHRPGP